MSHLKLPIPSYNRMMDPIFAHATSLHPSELRTTSRPFLQEPFSEPPIKQEEDVKVKQEPTDDLSTSATNQKDLKTLPWAQFVLSKGTTFVKEEHNYCVLQDSKCECNFCWAGLSSPACVFYPSQALTDKAILSDSSEDEEENSDDGPSNPKKCQNPGWFGKGYRKTSKSKKKRLT
jgi:hypothetical protein